MAPVHSQASTKKADPAVPAPANPSDRTVAVGETPGRWTPAAPQLNLRHVAFSSHWGVYLGKGVWSRLHKDGTKGILGAPSTELDDIQRRDPSLQKDKIETLIEGPIPSDVQLLQVHCTGPNNTATLEDCKSHCMPAWEV